MALSNMDFLLILVAILLPPVPVFIKRGFGVDFVINVVLSLLCLLPGIIHAIYLIFKYNDVNGVGRVPIAIGV